MKIGILGGRFDPPHLGHLRAASYAKKKYNLDQVWFVPYNKRSLQKVNSEELRVNSRTSTQRLEMARLLIIKNKKFRVLDTEIKRGGLSYTIDTVRELKKKYPEHEFCWIIGEDLVLELPKWKKWERLKKEIKFLTVKNVSYGKTAKISSSEIRKRVIKGLSVGEMVGEEVEKYINKNRLYI